MNEESLGQAIRRLRTRADYTLRGFAGLLGISAAYMSDIEHNRRVPTEGVLRKIANLLSKRMPVTYEELQSLSARLEADLQQLVQQTPEVSQLLREVKQTGRPAREVLRELQAHLRNTENEADKE